MNLSAQHCNNNHVSGRDHRAASDYVGSHSIFLFELLSQYRLFHYEHCGPDSTVHIDAYMRFD
jgi:hypothetical protein